MRLMNIISADQITEKLDNCVYPITIVKFLLNRKRILSYFSKAASKDFEIRGSKYTIDSSDCENCMRKKDQGILCRQHTSIDRVLTTNTVALDTDTNTYLFKNEIFKMVGNKLVIVYCPHTKLIEGDLTDEKVRKVSPIIIDDPNLKNLPVYSKIIKFSSNDYLDQSLKCWFNSTFSLVTTPQNENTSKWSLILNNSNQPAVRSI